MTVELDLPATPTGVVFSIRAQEFHNFFINRPWGLGTGTGSYFGNACDQVWNEVRNFSDGTLRAGRNTITVEATAAVAPSTHRGFDLEVTAAGFAAREPGATYG